MSDVDVSKLKVTELREELKKHGLDTKGRKEQLVKRLESFLSGSGDASLAEGDAALSQEDEQPVEAVKPVAAKPEPMDDTEQPAAAEGKQEAAVVEETTPKVEKETLVVEETTPVIEETTPSTEEATPPVVEETTPTVIETASKAADEVVTKEEKTEEVMEETATAETSMAEHVKSEVDESKPAEEVKADNSKTEGAQVGGEKRKRSHSPERPRSHQGEAPSYKRERKDEPPKMDSQDWVESEELTLDRYNCDLNVEVVNDGLTVKPNSFGGFGYMWGGVRANYGVTGGKVAFQMKTVKNLRIQIGEESVGANHVSRVGWSVDCGNYQLGEYPLSWGYGGTAKISTNSKFTDYSVKYYNGDVVTCYLDMTDEEKVVMYFAKNDLAMEKAAEVLKSELNGQALFPAFATKNQILEVNFGQMERPWFPLKGEQGEYTFIGQVPVEERVRAVKPPGKKEDCEVLLLIGLPGAGKSYWAMQRQREEPGKRHYVLGTNNIIDKMKVEGLPRKNNYNGRWDVLFDQANECLRKMLETATRRLKNYILDQTNVYDTAQKRKMRPFAGFKRKAVVVLPTDKVFRERIEKRTKEEGKEVPESAVLEMKANFSMPSAPVELALNPGANELAIKEEEERQAVETEKKAREEKKPTEEEKVKEEEPSEGKGEGEGKGEEAEEKVVEGGGKEEEKEVKEEKVEDEKEVVDAAQNEKEVKTEQKMEETETADVQEETSRSANDGVKEAEVKEETTDSTQTATGVNTSTSSDKPAEQVKAEETEVVFDEIWFTELSGDVARKLLAQYVKEGQVKFPPGSRRFRREDRRIGRDDRGGYRNDYRPHDGGYRDRRDNYGGYNNRGYGGSGGFNRNAGGGGYQNRGYDNRNRGYSGGSGGYGGNKGAPGGYRSGGYGKNYGGGNWGGQGGNWGGGQGNWGGQGSWNQGYGNQGNWGGYGGNQGGYGQGYNQGYGGGGGGGNYRGGSHSGSSWNQNNSYNSSGSGSGGYGNNYGSGY